MNGVDPPRGFAFAWFKIGNEDIGVYSLHLKSNLIVRGDREAETVKNIRKREVAITQLLAHIHDVIGTTMPTIKSVVIGGDFNTNHDQAMFWLKEHSISSQMLDTTVVLKNCHCRNA
jgi:endonuclease/exonuclease/phosphatase family metal-dependent hydrolase